MIFRKRRGILIINWDSFKNGIAGKTYQLESPTKPKTNHKITIV